MAELLEDKYLTIVLNGLGSEKTYEEIREEVAQAGGQLSMKQLREYADMYKTLRLISEDSVGELTFRSRNGRMLQVNGSFRDFRKLEQRLDWISWLAKRLIAEIENGGLWIDNSRTVIANGYETRETNKIYNGALVKNFVELMDMINKLMGDYRGKVQTDVTIDVSPVMQALQRTYQKIEEKAQEAEQNEKPFGVIVDPLIEGSFE